MERFAATARRRGVFLCDDGLWDAVYMGRLAATERRRRNWRVIQKIKSTRPGVCNGRPNTAKGELRTVLGPTSESEVCERMCECVPLFLCTCSNFH